MTNTGKVLIIGLLVVDLGVAGYLLFPKDDEKTPPASGTAVSDTGILADVDAPARMPVRAAQMASGSVTGTGPQAGQADTLTMTPPATSVLLAPSRAPAGAAPQVTAAAPHSRREVTHARDKSHPADRAEASADARRNAHTRPKAVQLAEQEHGRKHDDSHRRESQSKSQSKSASATMTARLVKESAKPDPSLPPPPAARGSHPVAAAMTDQLVRESSRVTPASQSNSQYSKH